jgi:F-type H+-transporting ATPase subunit epsilon
VHKQSHLEFDELPAEIVAHPEDKKILTLAINSGTVESKDNKVIVLAD